MPLAVIGAGTLKEQSFCLYLTKKFPAANLRVFQALLSECTMNKSVDQELSRNEVRKILNLAESEGERERMKYIVVKSSGISNKKAKRMYGFSDMSSKKDKVEEAMEKARAIKDAIENIAKIKEKVL